MPSRNSGDWLGRNGWPFAAAEAIAGMMSSVPPVAIMAVTKRQLIADRTGNNINCLSERRITKLCLTSSQVRENLPIAPSYDVSVVWKRNLASTQSGRRIGEAPIVHWMHVFWAVNPWDNTQSCVKELTTNPAYVMCGS